MADLEIQSQNSKQRQQRQQSQNSNQNQFDNDFHYIDPQQNLQQPILEPPENHHHIVQQNMNQVITQALQRSKLITYFSFFVALTKIIVSSVVLAKSSNQLCNTPVRLYLYLIMSHDVVCIIYQIAFIAYISDQGNINEEQELYEQQPEQPQSNINRRERVEMRHPWLKLVREMLDLYYFAIFLFGDVEILFRGGVGACPSSLSIVFYIYIIFQFMSICWFIIFILLLCLCAPVLFCVILFLSRYLGRGQQQPGAREAINQLIEHNKMEYRDLKHKQEGVDVDDCSICRVEYGPTDQVIQLKCSPTHYFHEQCIIDWLNISGTCPICRQKV